MKSGNYSWENLIVRGSCNLCWQVPWWFCVVRARLRGLLSSRIFQVLFATQLGLPLGRPPSCCSRGSLLQRFGSLTASATSLMLARCGG